MTKEKTIQDKNIDEKISKWIYYFKITERANIISRLRPCLKDSIGKNWVFHILPIVLYSVNLFVMMQEDVFWKRGEFSYLQDFTNSVGLTLLYFLSYFLSDFYVQKAKACFKAILKPEVFKAAEEYSADRKDSIKYCSREWGVVLLITGIFAGYAFFRFAGENPDAFWIVELSPGGKMIYCVILGLAWYHSLDLLVLVFIVGYIIFWSLRENKVEYEPRYFSKNDSIIKAGEILFIDFAYGLFYIGVAVLAIVNDNYIAVKVNRNIKNALCNPKVALVLMCVVLLAVMLAYIPVKELVAYMQNQKNSLLAKLDEQLAKEKDEAGRKALLEKRDELIKAPIIHSSLSSKLILLSSVIIPAIGVAVQLADLLNKSPK